jgi:hypothetical protein
VQRQKPFCTDLDAGPRELDDVSDVAALRTDDSADGSVGNVHVRCLLEKNTF